MILSDLLDVPAWAPRPFEKAERVAIPDVPRLVRDLLAVSRRLGAPGPVDVRHSWGAWRVPLGVTFPYLGDRYERDLDVIVTLPPGWVTPPEIQTSLAALNHALTELGPNGPFEAVRALHLVAFALRRALANALDVHNLQATIKAKAFENDLAARALKSARAAAGALDLAEQARDVAIERLERERTIVARLRKKLRRLAWGKRPAPKAPAGFVGVRGYVRARSGTKP